jgi:hypothetical protein
MSADRTTAWAERYQELRDGYIAIMGGDNITPTRRALAETIATLQCELLTLTNRFAGSARGGSPEDLALFLKLSSTISDLLQGAGIAASQQNNTDQNGGDALEKLTTLFNNVVRANEEDERNGIFHDARGVIITDPAAIVLEKWIYTLKGMRANPPPLDAAAATPAPATPEPLALAPSPANVIDLQRGARRAPEPTSPAPITAEKSTTQKFLDWSAAGGNGDSWSAGPSWPRG